MFCGCEWTNVDRQGRHNPTDGPDPERAHACDAHRLPNEGSHPGAVTVVRHNGSERWRYSDGSIHRPRG